MSTDREIIIRLYEEERNHARFHESQRAGVSNILGVISAAIIGFVTFDGGIDRNDFLSSAFLCVIGIYGMCFMMKATERRRLHFNRAYAFLSLLNEHFPEKSPRSLMLEADKKTRKEYRLMSRVPLATLWVAYHSLVVFIGLVLVYLTIPR